MCCSCSFYKDDTGPSSSWPIQFSLAGTPSGMARPEKETSGHNPPDSLVGSCLPTAICPLCRGGQARSQLARRPPDGSGEGPRRAREHARMVSLQDLGLRHLGHLHLLPRCLSKAMRCYVPRIFYVATQRTSMPLRPRNGARLLARCSLSPWWGWSEGCRSRRILPAAS